MGKGEIQPQTAAILFLINVGDAEMLISSCGGGDQGTTVWRGAGKSDGLAYFIIYDNRSFISYISQIISVLSCRICSFNAEEIEQKAEPSLLVAERPN